MVRVHPDPPDPDFLAGAIAQLGERLLCKQEVTGSIPVGSTRISDGSDEIQREAPPRARFAVSFRIFRLLFNNSEEVKRTRFSQAGFVWVRDCITEHRGFVGLGAYQALSMVLCLAPSRAQGYRVK
jgi:hypothetical protein